MKIFLIKNSLDGLLSALFYAYEKKIFPDEITADPVQQSLNDNFIEIATCKNHSERVKKFLLTAATKNLLQDTSVAFKSGEKEKFTIIFDYLRLATDFKSTDVSKNFADERVLAFSDLLRRIYNEVHRFKGFLRFQESEKGFIYAHYTPDNDVTEYLMPHFKARLGKLPFIIHDVKRNIVGLCDGKTHKTFFAENKTLTIKLSSSEKDFVSLWKEYYADVAIRERKNTRQMLNYMPARYHKDLPERN